MHTGLGFFASMCTMSPSLIPCCCTVPGSLKILPPCIRQSSSNGTENASAIISFSCKHMYHLHCEPKKHTKTLFVISSIKPNRLWQNMVLLFWLNLAYNLFYVTWIMSLHYPVELSNRILQVNNVQLRLWTENTSKGFCHKFYRTRPILIKFGIYFRA